MSTTTFADGLTREDLLGLGDAIDRARRELAEEEAQRRRAERARAYRRDQVRELERAERLLGELRERREVLTGVEERLAELAEEARESKDIELLQQAVEASQGLRYGLARITGLSLHEGTGARGHTSHLDVPRLLAELVPDEDWETFTPFSLEAVEQRIAETEKTIKALKRAAGRVD